jgi:acyl-CoA reductase-like NAD-dependent aldehyde dehydrogenase
MMAKKEKTKEKTKQKATFYSQEELQAYKNITASPEAQAKRRLKGVSNFEDSMAKNNPAERTKLLKTIKLETKNIQEQKKLEAMKAAGQPLNVAARGLKKGFAFFDKSSGRIRVPKQLGIQQEMTKGQAMLRELFGHGERTWGTGNNLPNTDEQILRSGGGIIKSQDYNRETGSMFGLRRLRR